MTAIAEQLNANCEQSCWTAEYLLGHCRGYRVLSEEGALGYVEEVVWADEEADTGEPIALCVRTGFDERGLITIMLEDVLELHPRGEWIVVRTASERAELPATDRGPAGPKRMTIQERASRSAPAMEFSAR